MQRPILLSINEPLRTEAAGHALKEAVGAGFDGVEGFLPDQQYSPCATTPASPDDVAQPTEVAAAESTRPGVTVVRATCCAVRPEEAVTEVVELIYRAAGAGASCLCLTLPPVRRATEGVPAVRYQDALTLAYKILRGARFDVEATGVALALEAATGGCLFSPVELREIIDAASSWAVGACVDAARLAHVGKLDDWATTLTHRVHAIRMPATTLTTLVESPGREEERVCTINALAAIPTERPVIVTDLRNGMDVDLSLVR